MIYHTETEICREIKQKFSSKWFITVLILQNVLSAGSAIFNAFTIYRNFITRPDRDPSIPQNLFQIIVYYAEFILIHFLLLLVLFFRYVNYYRGKKRLKNIAESHPFSVAHAMLVPPVILNIMSFNLFKMTYLLSAKYIIIMAKNYLEPWNCLNESTPNSYCKRSLIMLGRILCWALFCVLYYPLITFATLIKLSQVSFIAQIFISDWTIHHWLVFFGVVNNIASIGQDNGEQLNFLWKIIDHEMPEQVVPRSFLLRYNLYKVSKWKGLLWTRTMDAEDVLELIKSSETRTPILSDGQVASSPLNLDSLDLPTSI